MIISANLRPLLFAAVVAAVALPLAVLGLSAPLWLGVLAAAATLFAGAILARTRRHAPALPAPARTAFTDAEAAVDDLLAAAREVRDLKVRVVAQRIAHMTRTMIERARAEPGDLPRVQRALTYYAPRAAALADSYATMEDVGERTRLPEVARVLSRLDAHFVRCLDWLAGDARRALDLELRLIEAALDEDES